MCFGWINRLRQTLAFRLTLWYAAVFIVTASIAFILFYLLISGTIRQRTDNRLITQAREFAGIYAMQGVFSLHQAAMLQAQAAGETKMFFRLFYPSGVVFASSNMAYWKSVRIEREVVDALIQGRNHVLQTHEISQRSHKARVVYARIGATVILQLGYSLESEYRLLQAFKQIFVITMSVLLMLAVVVGWFMARRALSGVASLTRTASRISENDLDIRVPVRRRHDEIDQLAVTFNQMLDRIQTLVTGIRRMNDNIAHDLRSPITRIRGLAEVTLTGDQELPEYQQMAGSTIEECDRLLDMINTMLTISRTEAGVGQLQKESVNLATVVQKACELFRPMAEDKDVQLQCESVQNCLLSGDERMLQRMAANLIDNAIKYTPAGGYVQVVLMPDKDDSSQFVLQIKDNGIGIIPEEQNRVFERFFRGDQSRSQSGAGLGLSLARAIAQAHEGKIVLKSTFGKGSVFTVILPIR